MISPIVLIIDFLLDYYMCQNRLSKSDKIVIKFLSSLNLKRSIQKVKAISK